MLAIAKGLMSSPILLMLDEPSLGLAPVLVEEMFKVILDINQPGITALLVEQNVSSDLSIAHNASVLENGEIKMEGTSEKILNNPEIKTAYLGI